MKIIVIISTILIAQVSASFFDAFQGAMRTVQNGFGKLLTDVVTDVKDTVDCTILAVEHVLSLSDDATKRYYEKCGSKNATTQAPPKETPKVELSISAEELLKKEIPEEIDARINATLAKYLNGYNPHERLAEVESGLTKETRRLADVSEMVKQELDKLLSNEIHFESRTIQQNESKPSIDSVLEQLKLLEAIEDNLKDNSEAHQVHQIIDDVLHKLNSIESSEAAENAKVENILKELENSSNSTYKEIRQQLKDLKEDEDRHLDLIKDKIEVHEKDPKHLDFVENNKLNNTQRIQPNATVNNVHNSSTTVRNDSSLPTKQTETRTIETSTVSSLSIMPINMTSPCPGSLNISSTTSTPISNSQKVTDVTVSNNSSTVMISINPTTPSTIIANSTQSDKKIDSMNMESLSALLSNTTQSQSQSTTPKVEGGKEGHENITTSTTLPSTSTSVMIAIREKQPSSMGDLPKTTPGYLASSTVSTISTEKPSSSITDQPKTTLGYLASSILLAKLSDTVNTTLPNSLEERVVVTSTTSKNEAANLLAINDYKRTPKILQHQLNTDPINDVSQTTTPVAITTHSYIDLNSQVVTSTAANIDISTSTISTTTLTSLPDTTNQGQLSYQLLNETLNATQSVSTETTTASITTYPVTPTMFTQAPNTLQTQIRDHDSKSNEETIPSFGENVHSDSSVKSVTPLIPAETTTDPDEYTSTAITPVMTSKTISDTSTTNRAEVSQQDSEDNVQSSTMSATTEGSQHIMDTDSSSTTEIPIYSTTQPLKITTPGLNDFLDYIDNLVASSTLHSIPKTTESLENPASEEFNAPTTLMPSETVFNQSPPPVSITPLPYMRSNSPPEPIDNGPPPIEFTPPPPLTNVPIPHMPESFNEIPFFDKIFPIAPGSTELPPPPSLPNIFKENPSIQPLKSIVRPSDFFHMNTNEMVLTTAQPLTTRKINNFDDPDYDSFFHIPAKDTSAHDIALKEALQLIAESKRQQQVIESMLDRSKAKSIFG